MSKIKLRMIVDEIYEVDLSKCDFSYMTEEEIKNYLISEFLKNCDKESVRVDAMSKKDIREEWVKNAILETIKSYKIELDRELTLEEIHIITSSIRSNLFDHGDILINKQQ